MDINGTFDMSAHVLSCEVANEMVLLDKEQGIYFGLDAVGVHVWRLIGEGRSLSEICDDLEANYAVERGQLEQDVLSLVGEMQAHRLVTSVATMGP